MHKTNVCLTVNVEVGPPGLWDDPAPVDAHAERVDAWLALDLLARDDLRATFFVEALHTLCLGDEPMGSIARRIRAAGHDVQLLVRPGWMAHDRVEPPCGTTNLLAGRTRRFLNRVFDVAEDAFRRWEIPDPIAVRCTHPHVDRVVYEVMAARGLVAASHLDLAKRRPADASLRLAGGRHRIEGVIELPVLSYAPLKSFALATARATELAGVLEREHGRGADEVVFRMHGHDLRPHRDRFKQLCAFLAGNRDRFSTARLDEAVAAELLVGAA